MWKRINYLCWVGSQNMKYFILYLKVRVFLKILSRYLKSLYVKLRKVTLIFRYRLARHYVTIVYSFFLPLKQK